MEQGINQLIKLIADTETQDVNEEEVQDRQEDQEKPE